jgi:hypothetical protein
MSFLDRAKRAAQGAKGVLSDSAALVAQAASEGSQIVSEKVDHIREEVAITIEARKLEPLPHALKFFLDNETARVMLADAIASAEGEASEETSWDDILKAALLDLAGTPLGEMPRE